MDPKNIKLPLESSFAEVCGYIAALRSGLTLVAEDIDKMGDTKADKEELNAFIKGIVVTIFSGAGEIAVQLDGRDGIGLTTRDGAEVFAVKNLKGAETE